jgi:hypothetical protein
MPSGRKKRIELRGGEGRPENVSVPAESGMKPAMALKRVVFPAPFGPMT